MAYLISILLIILVVNIQSYILPAKFQNKVATILRSSEANDFDPNFAAHLPTLLKVGGAEDRPSPTVAVELRQRYKSITDVKRKASKALSTSNPELAIELQELADEIEETSESFVKLVETWDAWNRPSPDIGSQLRKENKQSADPNFEAHLKDMFLKGKQDRSDPDLPSELRMMKYKNMAGVQKLAARALKESTENTELAAELDEIADEISESAELFLSKANAIKTKKYNE